MELGEAALAERRIKEGSGIFVTGEEASRMAEEAYSRAALNRAVEEVRRDPAAAVSLVSRQEKMPGTPEEKKVAGRGCGSVWGVEAALCGCSGGHRVRRRVAAG